MVFPESTRRTWFKSLLGLVLVKKPVPTVVIELEAKWVEMGWLDQPEHWEELIRSNAGYWMTPSFGLFLA